MTPLFLLTGRTVVGLWSAFYVFPSICLKLMSCQRYHFFIHLQIRNEFFKLTNVWKPYSQFKVGVNDYIYVSPARVKRYIVFLCASVCPLVCLSIWLSITKACEHNSSYSFSWIFFWKFVVVLCRGLKMGIPFGCNPQIRFCHFFCCSDLKHLNTGYLVNATPTV